MIFCCVPFLIVAYFSTTSMDRNRNWCSADTVVFLHSSINPFLFCWRNNATDDGIQTEGADSVVWFCIKVNYEEFPPIIG